MIFNQDNDNLSIVVQAYVDCALWAGTDDNGEPLDDNYDDSDIDSGSMVDITGEVEDFINANGDDLDGMDCRQAGHDFFLTRNGHGAGFWDRGLGAKGDRLSDAAKVYGSSDFYVGDDGILYVG